MLDTIRTRLAQLRYWRDNPEKLREHITVLSNAAAEARHKAEQKTAACNDAITTKDNLEFLIAESEREESAELERRRLQREAEELAALTEAYAQHHAIPIAEAKATIAKLPAELAFRESRSKPKFVIPKAVLRDMAKQLPPNQYAFAIRAIDNGANWETACEVAQKMAMGKRVEYHQQQYTAAVSQR